MLKFDDTITARDYFMANAPADPQPWFNPDMPPCPLVPSIYNLPIGDLRDELSLVFGDCCEASSDAAKQWIAMSELQCKLQADWQADFRKQRYVQWPAAWADAMLEQRKC
jgi:hypothetical protein